MEDYFANISNFSTPDEEYKLNKTKEVRVAILIIITVLGICLNLAVIVVHFVWLMMKKILTNTGIIVTNMAVCDLILAVLLPLTISSAVNGHWMFSNSTCKASFYIQYVCLFVSAYTIVVLVVDKLIVAVTGKTSLRWWYVLVMLALWVIGAAVFSFVLFAAKVTTFESYNFGTQTICTQVWENKLSQAASLLVPFVLCLVLPIMALFILWLLIIISKLVRKRSDAGNYESTTKHHVGVMFICLAFLVLTAPYNVLLLLQTYTEIHAHENYVTLYYALLTLHEINLFVRPLIILAFRFVWPGQQQRENNEESVALKSTN